MTLGGLETEALNLDLVLGNDRAIETLLGIDDVVQITLEWSMTLTFGVDDNSSDDDVFVDTTNEGIAIHVTAVLDADLDTIGGIGVFVGSIKAASDGPGSSFLGAYEIDIADSDDRLWQASAPEDLATAGRLTGDGSASLDLPGSFFPGFLFDDFLPGGPIFDLDITSTAAIVDVDTTVTAARDVRSTAIGYTDVELDLGAFFNDFVKPTVEQLQDTLSPLKPVVDFLTAPVPVVSDLSVRNGGDPITTLDIAALVAGSSGHEDLAHTILLVQDFADQLHGLLALDLNFGTTENQLGMGSFTAAYNYDLEDTNIDTSAPAAAAQDQALQGDYDDAAIETTAEFFTEFEPSLAFPFLNEPGNLFRLMIGDSSMEPFTLDTFFDLGFTPAHQPGSERSRRRHQRGLHHHLAGPDGSGEPRRRQ